MYPRLILPNLETQSIAPKMCAYDKSIENETTIMQISAESWGLLSAILESQRFDK